MSEIEALTLRAQVLSQSVDFWNLLMLWGLALAAVAAVFVVVATRVVVTRTGQLTDVQNLLSAAKDRQLKVDLEQKDAEIAAAQRVAAESNKAAGEANERAGKAQASLALAEQHAAEANTKAEGFRLDIAKANESAKDAEARAAEANLELARFRAPRMLSRSQQANVASRLRPFGAKHVDVIVIGDAREIANLTENIAMALQQAGWNVKVVGKAISGPNVSGVLEAVS
jgi:chromosome segregation ATPase